MSSVLCHGHCADWLGPLRFAVIGMEVPVLIVRRALISVSDKTGLMEFAQSLTSLGIEIVSTGGTAKALENWGIPVTPVQSVTGFPEMMDGRVKTLHPAIHGAILARRNVSADMAQLIANGFRCIDLVVVNLYPFEQVAADPQCPPEVAIENIDIGGPAMIRSAAKNHSGVAVVVEPSDYSEVSEALRSEEGIPDSLRLRLAAKAFLRTAAYDAAIGQYLRRMTDEAASFPDTLVLAGRKIIDLRYGENPHQQASLYGTMPRQTPSLINAIQHGGKELSFNNIHDADAALRAALEFEQPVAVVVKHATPCGVAVGLSPADAFARAHAADARSIFGGIIAMNRTVDFETAKLMEDIFIEVVLAPGYTDEALVIFARKKNLRILELPGRWGSCGNDYELKRVRGGLLVQNADEAMVPSGEWTCVTDRPASPEELRDLEFAWKVVRHVKSNAIVLAREGVTVGIGGGQTSRIGAARVAMLEVGERAHGAVMASDGMFPFDDVVREACAAGVKAIVHPGGSLRDKDSIDAANVGGLAMYVTGIRHFKH